MVSHPRIQDQFSGPGVVVALKHINIYIKMYAVINYGSRTLFRILHDSVLESIEFAKVLFDVVDIISTLWLSVDSSLFPKSEFCSYQLQLFSVFTYIHILCRHLAKVSIWTDELFPGL